MDDLKAKVLAPNKQYTGTSASVSFVEGVGYTGNEDLLQWFEEHGYTVVRPEPVFSEEQEEQEEQETEETAPKGKKKK